MDIILAKIEHLAMFNSRMPRYCVKKHQYLDKYEIKISNGIDMKAATVQSMIEKKISKTKNINKI